MSIHGGVGGRVRAGATVHVLSSAVSQATELMLDRAVYVILHGTIPPLFSVNGVLDFVAHRSHCPPSKMQLIKDGERRYLLIFPEKFRLRTFLEAGCFEVIDGCRVQFESWDAAEGAQACCYEKMAWLRVIGMPKHHYNLAAAAALLGRFGKLWAFDAAKARVDYSSFDMVVECTDTQTIPREVTVYYDGLYKKVVRIEVELDMDVVTFDRLGYGSSTLRYDEIYDLALHGRRDDSGSSGKFVSRSDRVLEN